MRSLKCTCTFVGAALCLLLLASNAGAKSYKSGELVSRARYGFGAFEARIRSAQGPGVISTFFLWKPGSETGPSVPWHEIDFEMGQASGDYQTQIMTPGASPPQYRTEHAVAHGLPARAYQAYFTYRIEWTPDYIAFFVDGNEVRRETDQNEFAVMFAKDASGDTPSSERMELRTGVWPGDTSISDWSGVFDGSTVPTGHFVDYVKVWDYTPNQANKFATVLLDERFNSLNTNVWYPAQWTFDASASDYVSQNVGVRDGRLVVALTTASGQGILPAPPADVPPTILLPCSGLCNNPVIFNSNNFSSGNLGTGAACYETTANLYGGVCGNFAGDRALTVNGVAMSCAADWTNWPTPLPAKRNGGYCVQTTAGDYAWAYFGTW
jgi:beta-glucanase (GH16 family)